MQLDPKIIALCNYLEIKQTIQENLVEGYSQDDFLSDVGIRINNCIFEIGNKEYLVVDDTEREERFKESILNDIDEYMEIPDNIRSYFDEERFIKDCKIDGYGHILSPNDGIENEEIVNGEWFFIYLLS